MMKFTAFLSLVVLSACAHAAPSYQPKAVIGAAPNERIVRTSFGGATISTDCTTGNCILYNQGGSWVSTIVWSSAGVYFLNINSGVFSGAPVCVCTAQKGNDVACTATTSSPTLVVLETGIRGVSAFDAAASVICMGPK